MTFCVWIYRAHGNLTALGATNLRFSPAWAVGWYFVPIMNLFRPYQVMKELWEESDPRAELTLVKWWWGLWIVGGFVSAGIASLFSEQDLSEWLVNDWRDIGADVILIVAALLAVLIVRRIVARQDEQALATGAAATH